MQRTLVFLTKIVLLLVLIWAAFFLAVIVTTEIHMDSGISDTAIFHWHKNLYEHIRGFVLAEKQNRLLEQKLQNTFAQIDQEKGKFFSQVEHFQQDKTLYDAIFMYVVSGNLPSLREVIDTYWGNDPFLVECYVVGEKNELLYKHRSYTLTPTQIASTSPYDFLPHDHLIDFLLNWTDETFNRNLQFHFLFEKEKFLSWIKATSFPVILQLGNMVITTPRTPPIDTPSTLSRLDHYGPYTVFRLPLLWKETEIGRVFFFVKTYGFFWILGALIRGVFATLVFLSIPGFFVWLDSRMSQITSYRRKKDEEGHELDEQNIQWIEEFIAQQREEKK